MASPKYAWVVGAMCFCTGICTMTGMTIFGYCMTSMVEEFGIQMSDLGIIASVYTLFCNGLAWFAGIINQKIGPRLTMGFGMLGNAVFVTFIGLFASNAAMVIGFYCGAGAFACTMVGSVLPKLVSNWFAPNHRGKAMMLYTCGPSATGAVLGIVVPIILLNQGWHFVYIYCGGFCFILGVIFLLLCRNSPRDMGTIPFGYTAEEAQRLYDTADVKDAEGQAKLWKEILKNKTMWIFAIVYSLWMAYFASMNTYKTASFMAVGIDPVTVGLLNTMQTILVLVSQLLFSTLSDKFWSRNKFLGLLTAIHGCLQIGLFWILSTPVADMNMGFIFFYMACFGVAQGQGAIMNTINAEVFPPSQRATGPAVVATITIIGSSLGPIFAGMVIAAFDQFTPAFVLFSGPCSIIAGIMLWILIPKTGGKYGDPEADKEVKNVLGVTVSGGDTVME